MIGDNPSPRRKEGGTTENVRIKVSAQVLGKMNSENLSRGVAYAFSRGGAFLGRASLNEQGAGVLEIRLPAGQTASSVRVVIGPEIKNESVSVSELLRRGGEEGFVRIDPGILEKEILIPIIPDKILCWFLSACVVQGTVLKKVESGGVSLDLPVCDATVEIYEVDSIPVLIPKLPDSLIERLRDIIINPPLPPIPEPPPIGPFPPPPPPPPLRRENLFVESGRFEQARAMLPSTGAEELRFLARATNTVQFRQVLIDHSMIVRPLLCLLPFGIIKMDLVATAKTDECGKFKTLFFKGCNNPDTPDLYFKVKQKIFKFFPPITIYAPTPISCHTFWNYKCGKQEVTLFVTNPFAITCPPCPPINAPNHWVLFMAIGNLPLSRIHGASVPLAGTTTPDNRGLTDQGAPFGELLRPRLEFDNSLRDELGVKYYRVSYRKGTAGPFVPLTASISRHYTHEVAGDLILEVLNLGPKVINGEPNLFEIPPALPPIGQWTLPDAVEDTASAKFQTLNLAGLADPGVFWPEHGKYQIKVDLFDEDGNLADVDALGIKYRVPAVTDFSGTIDTEDAADPALTNGSVDPGSGLVRDDDGDGMKSMIVALHIDNSRCKAEIPAPLLDGTPADDDCGVMEYNPSSPGSVALRYTPTYPNGIGAQGFATYSFRLFRGANELTLPLGDPLPTIPDVGKRTPLPLAMISVTHLAEDLLGSCAIAGFSENLYVMAMATTGWRRLSEYDEAAVRAFVLAPPIPPSSS